MTRTMPQNCWKQPVATFLLAITALSLASPTTARAVCADPSATPRLDVPTVSCDIGQPCTVSIDLSRAAPPDEESVSTASAKLTSNKAITCTACDIESPAGYGNCSFN